MKKIGMNRRQTSPRASSASHQCWFRKYTGFTREAGRDPFMMEEGNHPTVQTFP